MRVLRRLLRRPGRLVPAVYLIGWLLGTLALMLPWSSQSGRSAPFWDASFTSMSALCITGLSVVDTPTTWSYLGQTVILVLIQVGGFGIMTLTSLVLFLLARRTTHLGAEVAQAETRADLTGIRAIPRRIAVLILGSESLAFLALFGRYLSLGRSPGSAAYHALFHAVSAFNNAGFALYSDNLVSYNADPFIMLPICAAIVAGGLGFPVYVEILRHLRGSRRPWSVHLRITLLGTVTLLLAGFATMAVFEWRNPGTLGGQSWSGKLLGALGGTVFPRTAGFNSFDYGQASDPTIAITYGLMMIGGGAAGTAGGLKVTTVGVLLLTVATEVAGEEKTVFARRKISSRVTRTALAVTTLATAAVFTGILVLAAIEPFPLQDLTFEAISAFGTVGLTTGITPDLSPPSRAVIMALMYIGRVGPFGLATALALHSRPRRYELPKEDPLVG